MESPEPKTLRKAASPMTVINRVFGIEIVEYPAGRPRRAFSICLSAMYIVILLNCVRMMEQSVNGKFSNQKTQTSYTTTSLIMNTYRMYVIAHMVFDVIVIYCGQARSKDLITFMGEIDKINDTLRKLGVPSEYSSIYKRQIIHLVGIFLYQSIILVLRSLTSVENDPVRRINFIFVGQYTGIILILGDYTFGIYVRYIGERLQYFNMYLTQLKLDMKRESAYLLESALDRYGTLLVPTVIDGNVCSRFGKEAHGRRMTHTLRNARNIYRDLCSVARNFNEAFAVQMLLSLSMTLATGIALLFLMYSALTTSAEITVHIALHVLNFFLIFCTYVIRTIFVIAACSKASTEAQRTGDLIHEFTSLTTRIEVKEEICAFSIEIMHDPLRFTACGFFFLDYKIIRAMIGTAATYLVFIIQIPHASIAMRG